MTVTITPSATRTAERVAAVFDGVFATIDEWRVLLERHLADVNEQRTDTLDPLVESFALSAVSAEGLIRGAGFVCAPGLLTDAAWHLAWWLADAPDAPRRLATVDDPESEQFRDYTALEWWRVPARTGARHLTGPYVDYVCTDDYTVTITSPVAVGGVLQGVVGIDALVDRLETEMLPELRALATPTAVVNASGRIVTATDARREPGSILRLDGLGTALAPLREAEPGELDVTLLGGARVLSCGETSLALVVGI